MLGDANLPLAQRLAWRATFPLVRTGILKGLGITPVRAALVPSVPNRVAAAVPHQPRVPSEYPNEYPTEDPSEYPTEYPTE